MILKNFNQYNYSVLALKIDYEKKTIKLYKGGECPISYDKKATKKAIYEAYENLKIAGFTEEK